jgi:hypothetical protein
MIEAVITLLIYVALICLAVYLVLWVLAEVGIALPPQVVKIIWVIVVLIVILLLVRTFLPQLGHLSLR